MTLLAQRPRDEWGTVAVHSLLSDNFGRVAREVFATSDLKDADDATKKLAKCAANRVILGGIHTGLSKTLRKWTEEPDLLASHVIDTESATYLAAGNVKRFLERRAATLRSRVDQFLHENAGFNEPVVRPQAFYLEPDDLADGYEAQ